MSAKKKPRDWRNDVKQFRNAIQDELLPRPGVDAQQSALRDAWDAVLEPRVRRQIDAANDFLKAKRWVFDNDDAGLELKPVHWNHVIRRIAAGLYVSLGGALRGYYNVRPVWREKIRFGILKGKNAAFGPKKQVEAQRKAAEAARRKLEKEQEEAYKATMELVLKGLADTRAAVRKQFDALQTIMNGLMVLEAKRLRGLMKGAPQIERSKASAEIDAMEEIRRNASSFRTADGRGASKYSNLLRRWNGRRRAAAGALA